MTWRCSAAQFVSMRLTLHYKVNLGKKNFGRAPVRKAAAHSNSRLEGESLPNRQRISTFERSAPIFLAWLKRQCLKLRPTSGVKRKPDRSPIWSQDGW